MDTCVQRITDGKLETVVYRKPTQTDKYLSFNMHHLRSHKKSVVTTLFQTAENLTSNNNARENECQYVTNILKENNYPKSFLYDCLRHPTLTDCNSPLGYIFAKPKDRVPTDQKTHAVYSTPCGDCEKVYLGSNKMPVLHTSERTSKGCL